MMRTDRKQIGSFFPRRPFLHMVILLVLCGVAVPMIVQHLVYYWQTEKNIQEEMRKTLNDAMDDKADKLADLFKGTVSLARNYYGNEKLYQYLDHGYEDEMEYLVRYQDMQPELFAPERLYYYQISNMIAYTNNPTLVNSSHIRKLEDMEDENLGSGLTYLNVKPLEGENGIRLRVAHEDTDIEKAYGNRSVSLLCRLDYYRQHDQFGKLLRIDIDSGSLEDILLESNLFSNMLLCDTGGRVVVAAKEYNNAGEFALFDPEEEGDARLVLAREIKGVPLTLYGIFDKGVIAGEFRQSRKVSVVISALCLSFALICVTVVVGRINRRLRRLVAQSEEIARGNFIQIEQDGAGTDEFTILEKSINSMSLRLQELIDREYKSQVFQAELEKETNQAKLLALQEQVNPHFMFNALESIRLKAMVRGERETADMIGYMAKMFRNLLDWNDNIILLREEVGFLDEFLHIQNYRFEDEFSYEIKISPEAYTCRIPKMTLQPLVENACIHGAGAASSHRWVKVEADVRAGRLILAVEDNGGGMTAEKLGELKDMLKGESRGAKAWDCGMYTVG